MGRNYVTYRTKEFKRVPLGSSGLAILMMLALLGMLPFTQYLAGLKKQDLQVRNFEISAPPPQFTPPEPPPPEPPPEQEAPPEMESPPPQISLSALNMSLNPGVGGALAADVSMGQIGVDASETMKDIGLFEMSELDEMPRKIREGRPVIPPKMSRNKINGYIRLEGVINEDGSVEYVRTIEASHREYETAFIGYMGGLRYTQPMMGGKPVKAKVYVEVPIRWE